MEDYQNYIRNSAYPHKAIIQYAYFMFYNGSNNYLDIVSQLDSQFMDYMLTTVMNLYNRNVIICVVCFVTSYIVTFSLIPFLFSLDRTTIQMVKCTNELTQDRINKVITDSQNFQQYLSKNEHQDIRLADQLRGSCNTYDLDQLMHSENLYEEEKDESSNGKPVKAFNLQKQSSIGLSRQSSWFSQSKKQHKMQMKIIKKCLSSEVNELEPD